ncbi:MAG TPA: c-type cytochrome [Solirubrobacteraceae bacterium]|nr:c-type cytochrome [Solirubrobacteraceae bacterium]
MRARPLVAIAAAALLAPAAAHAQVASGVAVPGHATNAQLEQLGAELYAGNCASCHGVRGEGIAKPRPGAGDVAGQGPPLRGVGERAADFYLRTGYMPLNGPKEQPERRRHPIFDDREIRALVKYVGSLGGGPGIPRPNPARGNLSTGLELFTEHCAGCHQVVAQGGFVTGARVPDLTKPPLSATEIAEAVRTGPYLMPVFSPKQIPPKELDDIIAYVQYAAHPADRGGWGIGNIGPLPEGLVTWFIAALVLVFVCIVIGERLKS